MILQKCADASTCPVCPKTQQIIEFLQRENKMLSQEKMTMMARLEQTRCDGEILGKCNRVMQPEVILEHDTLTKDENNMPILYSNLWHKREISVKFQFSYESK